MSDDDDATYYFEVHDLLSNTLICNHLQRLREYQADDEDMDESFLALDLTEEQMNPHQKIQRKRINRDRQEAHSRL